MAQTPKPLTDHSASVASQLSDVQQDVDRGTDVAAQSQTFGLATAQHETDIKGEVDEDWQSFKEAFEKDDFIAPQGSASTDFLSSAVVKQIRQELIADLMLTFHDARFGSACVPADCRPAQVQEQSYQTDSTLSFDKLDSVEQGIDHLLKECETNEAFREKLSATGSSTPPSYEAYNSDKAGDDLMQKLVACHMEKVKKSELSTTSVLEGAGRLESEDAPTIASTASTAGEL